MKRDDDYKTRILLRNNNITKKLCNIIKLKDDDGRLYEYKITFPYSGFTLHKNVHFSSIDGILKNSSQKNRYSGYVEICYHSGGKISYKNVYKGGQQIAYYTSKRFNKIKKYCLFLRISINNIKNLADFGKSKRDIDGLLEINNLINKSFTVDFYLSKEAFKLKPSSIFTNNYQFFLEDEEDNMHLLLHFYESRNIEGFYIQIIPDNFTDNAKRKILYYLYKYNLILQKRGQSPKPNQSKSRGIN